MVSELRQCVSCGARKLITRFRRYYSPAKKQHMTSNSCIECTQKDKVRRAKTKHTSITERHIPLVAPEGLFPAYRNTVNKSGMSRHKPESRDHFEDGKKLPFINNGYHPPASDDVKSFSNQTRDFDRQLEKLLALPLGSCEQSAVLRATPFIRGGKTL